MSGGRMPASAGILVLLQGGRNSGGMPLRPGKLASELPIEEDDFTEPTRRIIVQKTIAPFLWFDDQAEEAARFYTGIFRNSKIVKVGRYGKAGQELHGRPPGSVMTVAFELDGQPFTALNGGPVFKFNEAISFVVNCETQEEVDHYWDKLSKGGDAKAQQCGWLKDKYGVSWQVVPTVLQDLVTDPDSAKSQRAFAAMLRMKKLDIEKLERAYAGG